MNEFSRLFLFSKIESENRTEKKKERIGFYGDTNQKYSSRNLIKIVRLSNHEPTKKKL